MIGIHCNRKNQNPGSRFGATSQTILPIWSNFEVNGLDWKCCLAVSSKTAHRISIFSIFVNAEYLSYLKSIETHAHAFLTLNILSISTVWCHFSNFLYISRVLKFRIELKIQKYPSQRNVYHVGCTDTTQQICRVTNLLDVLHQLPGKSSRWCQCVGHDRHTLRVSKVCIYIQIRVNKGFWPHCDSRRSTESCGNLSQYQIIS